MTERAQTAPADGATHVYRWGNTSERRARKGHLCRVVARSAQRRGTPQSVCVEFADGGRMITSYRAIRALADRRTTAGQAELLL